ncbi:MAG: restriction endonuclease subunit S [Burkholderiaceae bacterium]|nr:MAG: restriction endonuclease subunit S [Burkholderiaceae bacterium]
MTVRYLRLADVCEINPRLPRTHGLVDDDEVSFVPMAAVDEVSGAIKSAEVRRYAEVKKGYTAFADGDVLFAKITPCMENGKAALVGNLVGGRGFGSTEFHVLRAGDQVIPDWLRYFVRREAFRHEAKRNFTGTAGQQRVPASFLQNALIPVPSRGEQQRIVDQLSRAEGIVRLRRQAQQKAAELIPAIFVDMFGDPATNPKGWPEKPVEVLCTVATGATPKRDVQSYYEGGTVPWVKTGEVSAGDVIQAEECITELAVAETNCKVFPAGTILIAMYGQGQTRGRVGMLKIPAATNQACAAILPSEQVNQTFLFEMLRMQYERLRAMGRGGNQANLNLGMIKSLCVPVPPLEAQRAFARHAEALQSIQSQQTLALQKTTATFDALLARAFAPEGAAAAIHELEEAVS